MSLHIARLQLRLPVGYGSRAGAIGRAIAEALARVPPGEARRIDALRVGPVAVADGASDQDVATAAAHATAERLRTAP